ncbi:hypothetical protein MKW98_023335, partial [Papaver atlanticum]
IFIPRRSPRISEQVQHADENNAETSRKRKVKLVTVLGMLVYLFLNLLATELGPIPIS